VRHGQDDGDKYIFTTIKRTRPCFCL
jgi:hypothetical protein